MSKETMTVGELIAKLSEYDNKMKVYPTWEGIWTGFYINEFEVVKDSNDVNCLVVDVDQWYP